MIAAACTSETLLLQAFGSSDAEALACWKEWRAGEDLEVMDPPLSDLVPLVAHARPEWIADDPARAILQGLCRRAWTRNQIAFASLARVVSLLRGGGVSRIVVRGEAGFALLCAERKSIRPVRALELLVGRSEVLTALDALAGDGWSLLPDAPAPVGTVLDRREGVWLRDGDGGRLRLTWRLLVCPPEFAQDRESLPALRSIDLLSTRVEVLPPEDMLVEALLGERHGSALDWRWDALAVLGLRKMNWRRVALLMDGDERGHARLRELQGAWNIRVPASLLQPRADGKIRAVIRRILRDYRWNEWNRGGMRSFIGLASYCLRRWWRVFVWRGGRA